MFEESNPMKRTDEDEPGGPEKNHDGPVEITARSSSELVQRVEGEVLFPKSKGFEKARTTVWNIDAAGVPAVIVKCMHANDVSAAMGFAKENKVRICVHTAGAHSSHAVVNDCVVIDLSLMRGVTVDVSSRTATIAGGATIGDVDSACKPHGLALPMGHVHHTGVAGMALNATSGVGYLCRTRKLTATFLKGVTLVMSDGNVKTFTEGDELFWGLQGAGANFGIAVQMVFSLTYVAPKVYAGDVIKFGKGTGPGYYLPCLDSTKSREDLVLRWFEFFQNENTPQECSSIMVIAPKGPVVSRICYAPTEGDASIPEEEIREKACQAFEPLTLYGKTLHNGAKMIDYWDGLQKLGQFPPSYYYQKGVNMRDVPPDELPKLVKKLCAFAETCPVTNMGSGIILAPLGGKLADMKADQIPTAEVFSKMKWWFNVVTEFPKGPRDPVLRGRCIKWVREVHSAIKQYGLQDQGSTKDYWYDVLGDIYSSNIPRLSELKHKYDPENIFSFNRNLLPR